MTWGRPEPGGARHRAGRCCWNATASWPAKLAVTGCLAAALAHPLRSPQPDGVGRRSAARLFRRGAVGAQFALPEAAQQLQELHLPSTATAPPVLLHSMDPANLYGSGAPFDIPLLDGGTRPLLRRPGNWLVLRRPAGAAGRAAWQKPDCPGQRQPRGRGGGGRLSARHLRQSTRPSARHKLTVEEWNGQPVTSSEGRACWKRLASSAIIRP